VLGHVRVMGIVLDDQVWPAAPHHVIDRAGHRIELQLK
jgi:hypothetical protein